MTDMVELTTSGDSGNQRDFAAAQTASHELVPANQVPSPMAGVYSGESVETLYRQRIETDREIKFSMYLVWMLLLSFTIIGAPIYALVTYYRLVNRRTLHFMRQQALWQQVINVQKQCASARGIPSTTGPIAEAERILAEIKMNEGAKNPWIHAIVGPLLTLGVWNLYTYYFLTVDWRQHADRHAALERAIAAGFRELGLANARLDDVPNIPKRNYWLYLCLTVITFGLFGLYWLYVIMADGNNHLKYHAFLEDQAGGMVRQLTGV